MRSARIAARRTGRSGRPWRIPGQRPSQGHRRVQFRPRRHRQPPPGVHDEADGQPDPLVHWTRPIRHGCEVCRARDRGRGLLTVRARPDREPSRDRRHCRPLQRQRAATVHPLPATKGRSGAAQGDQDPAHPAERRTRLRDLRCRHGKSSTPCATPTSTRTRGSSAGRDRPPGRIGAQVRSLAADGRRGSCGGFRRPPSSTSDRRRCGRCRRRPSGSPAMRTVSTGSSDLPPR